MVRRPNGDLHFFFNGVDKGVAASHVASSLYGVVDLYGQAAKVTIVDPAGEAFFGWQEVIRDRDQNLDLWYVVCCTTQFRSDMIMN